MTLAQIKAHRPCRLHDAPLDTFVSLGDIAAHYGATDVWWCVHMLDWSDIAIRRKVISVLLLSVKRAAKHTKDQRVHDCIAALDKWCAGDDSVDLQAAAWTARAATRATRTETARAAAAWAWTAAWPTRAAWAARAAAAAWTTRAVEAAATTAMRAAEAAAATATRVEAARAVEAAEAAWAAAWTAEHEQQKADLIAAFPPLHPYT
jgi:hypothetical protein